MKTLQELAKGVTEEELKTLADEHYEEGHEGYGYLLKLIQAAPPVDTKFTLHIDRVVKDVTGDALDEDSQYYDVNGTTPDDPGQSYSLGFTPWDEWANMAVDKKTLKEYTPAEIVTHCIYDMTFYGWDPTVVEEQKEELDRRSAEVDKWIEEGTLDEHCVSSEELFKDLGLTDDE